MTVATTFKLLSFFFFCLISINTIIKPRVNTTCVITFIKLM